MSHEERNTLVAILVNLSMAGWMTWRIAAMQGAGRFDGPDGLAVWARTVLWVIPVGIVVTIAAVILFNIVFAIATRDENPSFVTDERDRLIGIQGMRVTLVVASAGFLGALVALALGTGAFAVLNAILASFAAGDLLGSLAKLRLYRRGL